jgi:hypothetical protein
VSGVWISLTMGIYARCRRDSLHRTTCLIVRRCSGFGLGTFTLYVVELSYREFEVDLNYLLNRMLALCE